MRRVRWACLGRIVIPFPRSPLLLLLRRRRSCSAVLCRNGVFRPNMYTSIHHLQLGAAEQDIFIESIRKFLGWTNHTSWINEVLKTDCEAGWMNRLGKNPRDMSVIVRAAASVGVHGAESLPAQRCHWTLDSWSGKIRRDQVIGKLSRWMVSGTCSSDLPLCCCSGYLFRT